MKSVLDFTARKGGSPITMSTAYTHWEARLLADSPVDCVLVGDSVATVVDGEGSTFAATPEIIARHTAAVARGLGGTKFLIADFPFLAACKGIPAAVECAALLMRAGAHAVKIEGIDGHEDVVRHLVQSGVPVVGHIGLTPQSVNAMGGYKVQGRGADAAASLLRQARAFEAAGACGIVVECVPAALGKELTETTKIPVIGIGAGPDTDGQVLVFHDMLGLTPDTGPGFNRPRFVRVFAQAGQAAREGLAAYVAAVASREFPNEKESYR
ncbi:3-methyl-2-oxobutanoate hydroxymethyltransferase [Opitutaceae bacterium TAV4]|uniref:3-methyl-2-oxobutanoate hydroxymethyltransferase n=1 Tax=Geminisphaera colitermitum TaxID=1148786 RepID=UPI0001965487|nr:3-methyl-2-oxobutanoate hydroxymethyltransferase [Geminisphaera colitermitum]RRJ97929.1 3-methyl-2-oxobutanoate hydroxymethyltransferase [Opitutaceae bacterium TAV4]RRK02480.1 3-methyl-2-oxobutanoate hydroxymethyltransferase [Opitutaceae bacterium TAV3]